MSTVCATNSSAFSHYEWQDLVWMTNLFNGSANGGGAPVGVSACFDLPIDGGPATLPNGSGCYNSNGVLLDAAGNPETCKISFTGDFDNTSSVRGYPAAILGSRAGCKETWGVVCGATTVLMTGVRNNASGLNNNNCDIYDLQPSQGATGYPAFAGSLPSSQIVVDYNDCGAPSTYNVFSDTYWHDVSNPALLPIDVNGNPITSLQNTINGISDRDTKMWNLNFWHDGPTTFNATGGTLVASNLQIEAGKPVDVYVKHETGGNNNFFYLAFVFNPPQPNHVMDYNAYANWVMSSATGAGTFLTEVYNDPF